MPEWAFEVVWIGGPFTVGLVATALTRMRWPKNGPWMALIGVALAFGVIVLTYFRASHSYAGSQGDSDGEMFLGRWWEPEFTVFLATFEYLLWLLGVGAGIWATAILKPALRGVRKPAS